MFVHHVLGRARAFAKDYNQALEEYRREKKVRTASRPMPDLNVTQSSVESPFWLDDLAKGTRERASVWVDAQGKLFLVAPRGEEMELRAERDGWEAAGELSAFLRRNNLRLSPRALTLTLFLRLLVADGFVHGIGGGRYDQVTDRLIAAHFGIEPPRFAVTTATLYFPDAVGRPRACLPCVKSDGHRLKHSLLGQRKRDLVAAIAAAPRRSLERRTLFGEMHRELGQAAAGNQRIEAWQRELIETQQKAGEEKILFDRELFFAMQSRERLQNLIREYEARL